MNERRAAKFRAVARKRQLNLTIILENVLDMHNIGAVLRSCDSVGIHEIFVLQTEEGLQHDNLVVGKRTSMGTRKWVHSHYYTDRKACFEHVRQIADTVWSTHLSEDAHALYELDLTQPVALLFGNERDGISEETLAYTDGNFLIPQMGMAESLNISVACAVSLYEAYRQRQKKGFYSENIQTTPAEQQAILDFYHERHEEGGEYKIIDRLK